ncbi:MAG TPA: M67 family metallopeptidase [Anaerolineales bacterium]|nr:M67 family metallopeptidase [Anaerolineales bacterium]
MESLALTARHWEEMQSHVDACKPLEACGLLLGTDAAVQRVLPVRNAAQSPTQFRMDPAGQLTAFREMGDLGLELLGIFHSHPADGRAGFGTMEGPSATDINEAAYPVVHVIWSRPQGEWVARGFWIENGEIRDVPLVVRAEQ